MLPRLFLRSSLFDPFVQDIASVHELGPRGILNVSVSPMGCDFLAHPKSIRLGSQGSGPFISWPHPKLSIGYTAPKRGPKCFADGTRAPSTGARYQHYSIFERGYIRSSTFYLANFVIPRSYHNLWLSTPDSAHRNVSASIYKVSTHLDACIALPLQAQYLLLGANNATDPAQNSLNLYVLDQLR